MIQCLIWQIITLQDLYLFLMMNARLAHLTGETIIGSAHGTQEIVHVIVVDTPTGTVWCLAMEGFISGVVLRLCD